jgi:hypothetical protein
VKDLIGPRGLGDALLVRAVALEWLARGEQVTVYTLWPMIFEDLPITIKGQPERTGDEDISHCIACFHCRRPEVVPLDMFTRICHQAGLFEPVELRIDWKPTNAKIRDRVLRKANGRKVLIYQPPKIATGGEQALYNPPADVFHRWLEERGDYYRIKVGHKSAAHELPHAPCELNLFNLTTIKDVLDLATVGDLFFSQVCYLPTLAECLDKPSVTMFTRRQLEAKAARVRNLNPETFLHKRHLSEVVYVD